MTQEFFEDSTGICYLKLISFSWVQATKTKTCLKFKPKKLGALFWTSIIYDKKYGQKNLNKNYIIYNVVRHEVFKSEKLQSL